MLENKRHNFAVGADDFPLAEDGIVGNPFLHSYKFNLTNRYLELKGIIFPIEDNGPVIPKPGNQNNESNSDFELATDDIKYRFITANLDQSRINYVAEKGFCTRLGLLKKNTRLSNIEQHERASIEN